MILFLRWLYYHIISKLNNNLSKGHLIKYVKRSGCEISGNDILVHTQILGLGKVLTVIAVS